MDKKSKTDPKLAELTRQQIAKICQTNPKLAKLIQN